MDQETTRRCKFGVYCDYLHDLSFTNKSIALKVDILEKEKTDLLEKMKAMEEKFTRMETSLNEKVEMIEARCLATERKLKRKAAKIEALEAKFKEFEETMLTDASEDDVNCDKENGEVENQPEKSSPKRLFTRIG